MRTRIARGSVKQCGQFRRTARNLDQRQRARQRRLTASAQRLESRERVKRRMQNENARRSMMQRKAHDTP